MIELCNIPKERYCQFLAFFLIILLENIYNILDFKRDHVFPVDHTARAVAHLGLTALTFLVTLKSNFEY